MASSHRPPLTLLTAALSLSYGRKLVGANGLTRGCVLSDQRPRNSHGAESFRDGAAGRAVCGTEADCGYDGCSLMVVWLDPQDGREAEGRRAVVDAEQGARVICHQDYLGGIAGMGGVGGA